MPKAIAESGTDNVFADIGVPDAEEYLAKADLARAVARLIKKQKLKKGAAARLLGTSETVLAALVRGSLSTITIDELIRFLDRLGATVTLSVSEKVPSSTSPLNQQQPR